MLFTGKNSKHSVRLCNTYNFLIHGCMPVFRTVSVMVRKSIPRSSFLIVEKEEAHPALMEINVSGVLGTSGGGDSLWEKTGILNS